MDKKTIGVVGGGQLCLMMGEAIKNKKLPYRLIALDPTPICPASKFIDKQIVGDYKDENLIKELAESSDIVTFEIELANSKILSELKEKGKLVYPSPEILRLIQDKYIQADFLRNNKIPVPDFEKISTKNDLENAIEKYGLPIMIKARKDSYDGKGNYVLKNKDEIENVFVYFKDKKIMVQRYIAFDIEISVICARSVSGKISTFPVAENIHGKDYNILETTIVPARVNPDIIKKAKKIAIKTMDALKGVGVFAIEFLVKNGEVLINEIAPRVHNSGHFSIEACNTSQFEQHIKAIGKDSLGDTNLISSSAVMYNINGKKGYKGNYQIMFENVYINGTKEVLKGVTLHNYGKDKVKPFRKMGHITVVAQKNETQDDVIKRAKKMFDKIKIIHGGEENRK
ncbi:MAG: 5-(carboxyamino)imidazole ribonucleotide synthase [Minisyncoccales bacterium]